MYKASVKCLARRFYPNFVRVDSSFNAPYIKYQTAEVDLNGLTAIELKRRGLDKVDVVDLTIPYQFSKPCYEYQYDIGEYWEVTEIADGKMKLRKLIENTTVSTMGCADGEETVKIRVNGK